MVSTSPPKPYAAPTRTSCHDHTSPRSARGPLPRTRVTAIAVAAASTVGTVSATVSPTTDRRPPPKVTPISRDTPTNTASTSR